MKEGRPGRGGTRRAGAGLGLGRGSGRGRKTGLFFLGLSRFEGGVSEVEGDVDLGVDGDLAEGEGFGFIAAGSGADFLDAVLGVAHCIEAGAAEKAVVAFG